MDTNPYDTQHLDWQEWRKEPTSNRPTAVIDRQPDNKVVQKPIQQQVTEHQPQKAARLPKAKAMARARTLKKYLTILSLLGFGSFSWLAASHVVQASTSQSTSSTSSSTVQATPTTSSSSQSTSGNFFNQQGGNNLGSSSSGQQPVTGSSVS